MSTTFPLKLVGLLVAAVFCSAPVAVADTKVSENLPPGGSITLGTDPSPSDPIAITVTVPQGGPLTVEKVDNPVRPGALVEEDQEGGPQQVDWFGPAIRITPPPSNDPRFRYRGQPEPGRYFSLEYTLDGSTYVSSTEVLAKSVGVGCDYGPPSLMGRYLPNLDFSKPGLGYICDRSTAEPVTLHFYNPKFALAKQRTGPGRETLNKALKDGFFEFAFGVSQRSKKTVTASIKGSTARALGLKSAKIGSAQLNGVRDGVLEVKLTKAARKALKRAKTIGVTFSIKAVGTKPGQVIKRKYRAVYKERDDLDDIS